MAAVGPWAARVTWLLLPLLAGPALGDALDDASRPVQAVASGGLWAGWTAVLVATLVPRAASLTVVRVGAPAALAVAVAAAARGPAGADDAVALAAGVAVVAAAWWSVTADAFVDGSSYGDERRFALRSPPSVLLGAAPVAWLLAVAVPAAAALLLAAGQWLAGGLLAVVGGAGVALGVPALHRLSRRWLVLVPAGIVLHDHLALADPILLRRPTIAGIGPARDDAAAASTEDVIDLSLGAGGLVVAIDLRRPTDLPVAEGSGRSRRVATRIGTTVLVAPGRPGAFLTAAHERRPADLPR
jgi:hypothetical protein